MCYLAVHFGLAAMMPRLKLADRISGILGLVVMLPLGLIILILIILIEQGITTSSRYEPEVQITNWVFASLVLFLLVVPSALICRNILCSFLQRRAEQALGEDSP